MTQFLYNGVDVFSGICPTPLFSRRAEMIPAGERWGERQVLTLQGQITGKCTNTYSGIIAKKRAIISGFARDYQDLVIRESGVNILTFKNARVDDISFPDSTFAQNIVPFKLSLSCYPSGYFSGQWGVLSPKNSIVFSESQDGKVTITQDVGAQGFPTQSGINNSLTNARSWVSTQTGWAGQVSPLLISGIDNPACLQSIAENIDRLNGTYGVKLTYVSDRYGSAQNGMLRYSTEYASGIEDGLESVTVRGNLQGCRYQDITTLRSGYQSFDAFCEALSRFNEITSRTNLNPTPVSQGIGEDSTYKSLTFEYVYNTDMRPPVCVSYTVSFSYNFESDIVSATISATVRAKSTYNTGTWAEVQRIANSVNLMSMLIEPFSRYVADVAPHLSSYPLNPHPSNVSRSENEFGLTISLSATYTNAPIPPIGLHEMNSSVDITPSLRKFSAGPILDGTGQYYIFDLGYASRAEARIQAQGRGNEAYSSSGALTALKTRVMALGAQYGAGTGMLLTSQNYSSGNVGVGIGLSASASYTANQVPFSL